MRNSPQHAPVLELQQCLGQNKAMAQACACKHSCETEPSRTVQNVNSKQGVCATDAHLYQVLVWEELQGQVQPHKDPQQGSSAAAS